MGLDGADPRLRTATPGRSEIFSAKVVPGLFWNSTCDFDAVDWYCSSEIRAVGEAETTTSFSLIADSPLIFAAHPSLAPYVPKMTAAVVAEVYRVLRPGGKVIAVVPALLFVLEYPVAIVRGLFTKVGWVEAVSW